MRKWRPRGDQKTSLLNPKPFRPTVYLTSPLGCLTILSNVTCPKVISWHFSLQPAPPAAICISIMASSFSYSGHQNHSISSFLHISLLMGHKILLALPSQHVQNLTMSHHLHGYHVGPSSPYLTLGWLEQASNQLLPPVNVFSTARVIFLKT